MPYDLTGRSLTRLSELISEVDFPLADFLPRDRVASVLDGIYYTEADIGVDGENVVVSARLAFEHSIEFVIPGCGSFSLLLASAGERWTSVSATFVIGPDLSLRLEDVSVGIRLSERVLKDVDSDGAVEISVSGDLTFSPDGLDLSNASGGTLGPAFLAGTEIVVEARDVLPVFGSGHSPAFLAGDPDFAGLAFELLSLSIPSKYLHLDDRSKLEVQMRNAVIGTTGFTGKVKFASEDPIRGALFGFPFRFRQFSVELVENSLVEAALEVDLRLQALESSAEKWIGLDVSFGAEGAPRFSAALSALQPSEAGTDGADLVTAVFSNSVRLGLRGLRLDREGDDWNPFFTGNIEVLIDGADQWPRLEFEEIGISADDRILLPDGGGIVFSSPLVAQWHFVRLTVAKFRFGRPDGERDKFQLALSAEVKILDELPAGVSVDGLTITWKPTESPEVSLRGLGLSFGIPGSFKAEIEMGYVKEGDTILFRGHGSLALYALDMIVDVGILVGEDASDPQNAFNFLYLFADAKLLPTGIPIGSTGLSIYGFQGLLAYNMALAVRSSKPVDERYYELFMRSPHGITHLDKWKRSNRNNALGAGIILGTADKGFLFNMKGLVVVAFPDLTLLVQAKALVLQQKPDLHTERQGSLQALLVYAAGDRALTFSVLARWGIGDLFRIGGTARALFSFADSEAWYLQMGRDADGERFRAQVLKWGNNWLFSAGFWLRLEHTKLVTGFFAQVGLRASAGGFFVEAVGRARAEMKLSWEPPQWEGSAELFARIAAGYRGISIGLSLHGGACVTVANPFEFRLSVEACFKALFWRVCMGHTFQWAKHAAPTVESPVRLWSATPRHWTPDLTLAVSPDAAGLDTGRRVLRRGDGTDHVTTDVPPHSTLSLDFGKPMLDTTGRFNDAATLAHCGFITIGKRSGYNAQYRLDDVKLIRDPERDAVEVPIWGTWAQETLEHNTTLRLLSSERFGHDGSLSESFADGIEIDYCAKPTDTEVCVSLAGLEPGRGVLDDGTRFHWQAKDSIVLGANDQLFVYPPQGIDVIVFRTVADGDDNLQPDGASSDLEVYVIQGTAAIAGESESISDKHIVAFCYDDSSGEVCVSLAGIEPGRGVLADGSSFHLKRGTEEFSQERSAERKRSSGECIVLGRYDLLNVYPPTGIEHIVLKTVPVNRVGGRTYEANHGSREEITVSVGDDGRAEIHGGKLQGACLFDFCYGSGHAPRMPAGKKRSGTIVSEDEYWTVDPERRLLQPETDYELHVIHTPRRRRHKGSAGAPLGTVRDIARFRTSGPPLEPGALTNYVAGTYPAHGARPVYLGYDFIVRFVEDYVPFLYTVVGRQLAIRLVDPRGEVVKDESGHPVLLPASRLGRVERGVSELEWERTVTMNVKRNCIRSRSAQTRNRKGRKTVLGMPAPPGLLANSQYVAELVAVGTDSSVPPHRPHPLYQWTFTTSRYSCFSSMIDDSEGASTPARVAASVPTAADDFDAAIRRLRAPSVAYVDRFTATPYLDADRKRCVAVLLEAPEPLETGLRLDVLIAESRTDLIANLDETRVIVLPQDDVDWAGQHLIKLRWKRSPNDIDEDRRSVTDSNGTPNADREVRTLLFRCGHS